MCLYIDAEEHELGDIGEPANYKAALLDPKSDIWLNAMNVEMQSMKDNEVWDLVDLPSNGKTVGSKWLFKKKTNMDGVVHTYKAHLVAKGYTQTPRIDYEETFSHVADIRAIRILIAIAMRFGKWMSKLHSSMDISLKRSTWSNLKKFGFTQKRNEPCVYLKASGSNVTFLILYGDDILIMGNNIPMLQDVKSYLGRCFAMKDLGEATYILGIKIYEDRSRRLIEKLRFSKSQGAATPAKLKRMQNVPYASNVGFIMNTKDMFLDYRGDIKRELRVSCYTDAGYLTDVDDLKSLDMSGYIAAYDASKEAVWVRKFIFRLGVVSTIKEPINMYCDNTGVITIANESRITKGARHFRAKVHYLREVIEFSEVKLEKVHTDDNLADPFTKALDFPKHSEHTKNIGMLSSSSLNKKMTAVSQLTSNALALAGRRFLFVFLQTKVVKNSSKLFKISDPIFHFLPLILSSSNTNPTHPPPTTTSSQPPPPSHPPAATIQATGNPHPAVDDHHHPNHRRLHHLSRHKRKVYMSYELINFAQSAPKKGARGTPADCTSLGISKARTSLILVGGEIILDGLLEAIKWKTYNPDTKMFNLTLEEWEDFKKVFIKERHLCNRNHYLTPIYVKLCFKVFLPMVMVNGPIQRLGRLRCCYGVPPDCALRHLHHGPLASGGICPSGTLALEHRLLGSVLEH
ncbi:retrotransposon protein, putative, ty1-copia subclass [Tanacetum coccineum]